MGLHDGAHNLINLCWELREPMYVGCAPQVRTAAAAAAATPPQPLDPPPARAAMASPAISVRQQADDVSNVIQFENLRKEICKGIRQGTLERELVNMLHLDELYVLALKTAVSDLEPKSAGQISKMKTWVVSARARPTRMAQVEDSVLLTFISKELMEHDVRLAEDLVVDERFAVFLSQIKQCSAEEPGRHSCSECWRGPGSRPTPATAKGPGLPQVPLRAQFEGLHLPCGDVDAQRPPQPQLAGRRASPRRQEPEGRRGWRYSP
jgi:hypothetical protein